MSPGKFPDLVRIDLTSSFRVLYSLIKHSLPHAHTSVSFRLVTPYTSSYPVFITEITLGISITDRSGEEDMHIDWSVSYHLDSQWSNLVLATPLYDVLKNTTNSYLYKLYTDLNDKPHNA